MTEFLEINPPRAWFTSIDGQSKEKVVNSLNVYE